VSGRSGLLTLDQDAVLELRARAHERHQVGSSDRAPAGLGGLNQLEHHGQGYGETAGSAVTLVRSLTVEKVDSMGFVVRRWIQRSAGKW
jgi:hypothetical protein